MTVVSHEREPGELGYVARYRKVVNQLAGQVREDPDRFGAEAGPRPRLGAWSRPRCCALHVCRRLSDRLDGITHGPEGSVDKLLMTIGRAGRRPRRARRRRRRPRRRRRHLAEGVPVQPGPERHGRHLPDPAQPRRHPHPGAAHLMSRLRPARRDPGRGRRPDPGRPPQPARRPQRHQPRAPPGPGRAVPAARRRPRRPGRRAHRQRPGLLGRRRLRLHRRAHQGRRPAPRDARRTAARS